MKHKNKLKKHHPPHHLMKGDILIILIFVIVAFGILLTSGAMVNKSAVDKNDILSNVTCCDTGDGNACTLNDTDRFTWKGTNSTPKEYALIKSGVALSEGGGHLAPDSEATPKGEKIFLNTSDRLTSYSGTPGCEAGKDLVFGTNGCVGIPNDEIIYVCKSNCEGKVGVGKFDAYFRVEDGAIPDVIKNCIKPRGTGNEKTEQKIIVPPAEPGKENLQLKTFKIEETIIAAQWLSPYCKPAIYLYPEVTMPINVKIKPVGPITLTIPQYPVSGWSVVANPQGEIFTANNIYDYLYYEAEIPDNKISKPTRGYVVEKQNIKTLLQTLLPKLGLNNKEKEQFVSYWESVLPNAPYYFIGIVDPSNLDEISPLTIFPKPATSIRVTLYFEPLDSLKNVTAPDISGVIRKGFTVVEWGGIFKKTKNYPFSCFQ